MYINIYRNKLQFPANVLFELVFLNPITKSACLLVHGELENKTERNVIISIFDDFGTFLCSNHHV